MSADDDRVRSTFKVGSVSIKADSEHLRDLLGTLELRLEAVCDRQDGSDRVVLVDESRWEDARVRVPVAIPLVSVLSPV